MRDSGTTTQTETVIEGTQAPGMTVPASYDEIYEADDYMAIIDAAYGPEATRSSIH